MKTKLFVAAALAATLTLTGCGKPTIDTSSFMALKESSEKVKQSLPEDKRAPFERAFAEMAMSHLSLGSLLRSTISSKSEEEASNSLVSNELSFLKGLTGEEVLAQYEKYKTEQAMLKEQQQRKEAEERAAYLEELKKKKEEKEKERIAYLEDLRKRADEYDKNLQNFRILDIKETWGKYDHQHYIDVRAKNETGENLSSVHYEVIAGLPGAEEPAKRGTFFEYFPTRKQGVLEKDAERTWRITLPYSFKSLPPGTEYKIRITEISKPTGKLTDAPVYRPAEFTSENEKELAELKKKYE